MLQPSLPAGREIDLPGRGTTFIREVPGPPGASTLLLLHGLAANADLNWFPAFEPLGRHFRVVALDHRGHGRGIRSSKRFRLTDCADDAAAVADLLGIERVIAVGYSMGGPVAQLLWRRHRHLVEGLVLCATSRDFRGNPRERLMFAGLPAVTLASKMTPVGAMRRLGEVLVSPRLADDPYGPWAMQELRRGDSGTLMQAVSELGRFTSRAWVGEIDVPVAVVVHTRDQTVPTHRQVKLFHAAPSATLHAVDGDHFAAGREPEEFVATLLEACLLVARRAPAFAARLAAGESG